MTDDTSIEADADADADSDADADADADADTDCVGECEACSEAGYWYGVHDLDDPAQMRNELDSRMASFVCDYGDTTTFMFLELDNVGSSVECIYTGRTTTVVDEKPDHNTDMNTEHSWPQSQGAGEEPAKCDLHHLYPADVDANQARAAHPFGTVTGSVDWQEGGSRLGFAGSDLVFEPRAEVRGNIARGMLYFALRYGYSLSASELQLYRQWHAADPVDDDELDRTFAIADHQAFANPFVACPSYVDRAW